MKQISGNEAIRRMRLISKGHRTHFVLIHWMYNRKTGEGGDLRKVENCRLRTALSDEAFNLPGDLYLPYIDQDTDTPKMCWRILIKAVGFPPNYELYEVDWFNNK